MLSIDLRKAKSSSNINEVTIKECFSRRHPQGEGGKRSKLALTSSQKNPKSVLHSIGLLTSFFCSIWKIRNRVLGCKLASFSAVFLMLLSNFGYLQCLKDVPNVMLTFGHGKYLILASREQHFHNFFIFAQNTHQKSHKCHPNPLSAAVWDIWNNLRKPSTLQTSRALDSPLVHDTPHHSTPHNSRP